MVLRAAELSDYEFLKQMLYEAVFWRPRSDKPSFEEGLNYPDVQVVLKNWGERDGDMAVVAEVDSKQIGAAWIRFWTEDNQIRGYADEKTPVLGIGVSAAYRHQGIGKRMMDWIIDYASKHGIKTISLAVSKDNYAINLYRQKGFKEYIDKGDWFVMARNICPEYI